MLLPILSQFGILGKMANEKFTNKDVALGKKIARVRNNKGMTQQNLSDKTGISMTTISMLEVGKRRVSLKLLQKVASALNVKVQDLIPF